MKRTKFWKFFLGIGILLALSSTAMAQLDDDDDDETIGARMPVQLYLMSTLTDHVNIQITEDRIRRIVALLDKYRNEHPEAKIAATLMFSGTVSDALAQRNGQTHIVDLVKDAIRRGVVEVGYDGTDEPTYSRRPMIDMKMDTPEGRWQARALAFDAFLTESRDPITGAPQPGKSGGLKRMQEVFGPAASITGMNLGTQMVAAVMPNVGSDSEAVNQIRKYNDQAMIVGLPEENPLHMVTYRPWSDKFSNNLAPYPITSPELFWQDGVLRVSESVGVENRLFPASYGKFAFAFMLRRMDRNKSRVIHIELGTERNYVAEKYTNDWVYPPTRYAYGHADHPELPADGWLKKSDVDAAFAREDELIDWLCDDFLPEHLGSRFATNSILKKMTPPDAGYEISAKLLRSAVSRMLQSWGDETNPPEYVNVSDYYFLSLAQTFQVLADALAGQSQSGKVPEKVRVAVVHGPLDMTADRLPVTGEVTAGAVAKAAAGLVAKLHDDQWNSVPRNVVPTRVVVDGLNMNPAQFLRVMAEALVAPSADTKLRVKPTTMFANQNLLDTRTRAARDMGIVWTLKPAPLSVSGEGFTGLN